jgi:hypothetical protein
MAGEGGGGFLWHCNETSGSVKGAEFLEWLKSFQELCSMPLANGLVLYA